MGKTRDLFNKIRDSKGTFPAKMGTIKDRNDKDLTEAEEICFQELARIHRRTVQKKVLRTWITRMVHSLTRARHLGMRSQMGLRKHYYKRN